MKLVNIFFSDFVVPITYTTNDTEEKLTIAVVAIEQKESPFPKVIDHR